MDRFDFVSSLHPAESHNSLLFIFSMKRRNVSIFLKEIDTEAIRPTLGKAVTVGSRDGSGHVAVDTHKEAGGVVVEGRVFSICKQGILDLLSGGIDVGHLTRPGFVAPHPRLTRRGIRLILAPPMVIISHIEGQKDFVEAFVAGVIKLFEVGEGVVFFDTLIKGLTVVIFLVIDIVVTRGISGLSFGFEFWSNLTEGITVAVMGHFDGLVIVIFMGFVDVLTPGKRTHLFRKR